MEIEVLRWVSFEESQTMTESVGGMGGWVDGQTWDEYLKEYNSDTYSYLEAIRKAVIEQKLKVGGDGHQAAFCPVFNDGTTASFSYRAWGDLMAAIYNTEEKTRGYSYMDFYMDCLIKS